MTELKKISSATPIKPELLNALREKFDAFLEFSGDSIHIIDIAGNVVIVNSQFCVMLGYSVAEIYSMTIHDWDVNFSKHIIENKFSKAIDKPCVFESRYKRKDGTVLDVEISTKMIVYQEQCLLWCSVRDIVDRKKMEARLQLASKVFTHARESIIITDANANIIEVNNTFIEITGYSREEVIGKNPRILQSGRQINEFYTTMWKTLIETGQWCGEIWNRRKDGSLYVGLMTIGSAKDVDGITQYYVALFTDITQMKEHEWQLERVAHYDPLTNLPNRVLFADRLRQAMIQCQRNEKVLALVFIDIDGFKLINDQHGHTIGDDFLIAISKRMKSALREGDSLSRFGGDEFVAVITDLDRSEDCEPLLMRLLQDISKPIRINKIVIQVTGSIGVSFYPQSNVDADQLIRQADQAMYVSKQAGKNRYHFFNLNQDLAIKTLRNQLDEIKRGLEHNEFVLYYQPKVNMKTGEVIGAEALIRWLHPDKGVLSPISFLHLVEAHPLSIELGNWVIETALTQIDLWNKLGLDINVSINISGEQLLDDEFVNKLEKLLANYPEVNAKQLELEVLETSALEDIEKVSSIMTLINNLGVNFALDDFGTGFSSLTYLKKLPTTTIKIDQSFVRDVLFDTNDLAIVNGVISLAKVFRRQVIAEGVETTEHGELLLPLGCELAQGYGIAKPMSADLLPDWIKNWQPEPKWTIWQIIEPNRHHVMMVFAEVEQRSWYQHLLTYLSNVALVTFAVSEELICFENWKLIAKIIHQENLHECFCLLEDHEKLVTLGKSLALHHFYGNKQITVQLFEEFHELHHQLIIKLKKTDVGFIK